MQCKVHEQKLVAYFLHHVNFYTSLPLLSLIVLNKCVIFWAKNHL